MNNRTFLLPGLVLLFSLTLTACSGGGATMQASTTTMGQELMDLNASYKKGLISEKEYDKAKDTILEKYE